MQHIKNFHLSEPTPAQLKAYENEDKVLPLFLTSEDGQDWYDCQNNFAPDTIKIMYDADGIIHAVVDKPVPERGNTLAVSMLWPVDMSVAEVSALPEGFETDSGTWKFSDGTIVQDDSAILRRNTRCYNRLRCKAAGEIIMLQSCAETGRGRPDDEARIQTLRTYLADLRETDLTAAEPDWPAQP